MLNNFKVLSELQGTWSICVGTKNLDDCEQWHDVQIPIISRNLTFKSYSGWVVIKRKVAFPESCKSEETPCGLIFRELGGNAIALINGRTIGSTLKPLNDESYNRRYYLHAFIPPDLIKLPESELVIKVYSRKNQAPRNQSTPVAIVSFKDMNLYARASDAYLILFPLFFAIFASIVLGVYLLIRASIINPPLNDRSFILFIFSAAANLLSYSSLLDGVIGNLLTPTLHFISLCIANLALSSVSTHTRRPQNPLPKVIWIIVSLPVVHLLLFFTVSSLTSTPLEIALVDVIKSAKYVMFVPLFCNLYSLTQMATLNNLKRRRIMTVLMALCLVGAILDVLTFWAFIPGVYLTRIYPMISIFGFTWIYFDRLLKHRQEEYLVTRSAAEFRRIAHDIRAPISIIKSLHTEAMVKEPESDVLLRQSIERITTITEGLLKSKPRRTRRNDEHVSAIFPFSPFKSICEITAETLKRYRDKFNSISIDVSGDTHHMLSIDRIEFQRVMSNLLSNAVEACVDHAHVKILISSKPSILRKRMQITITDNGNGFPKRVLEEFGSFGVTNRSIGNGLGLYSALTFIKEVGGNIRVYNLPAGGSCVELEFRN
ncbi:MAG: hypothetical protein EOP48_14165 [Sphingobacteriales bacterium]|nr:MAG: hypothetical protein EOP48_14165 [Sphingobacteriales bacterium]